MLNVRRALLLVVVAAGLTTPPIAAQGPSVDRMDPDMVYRVKYEGLQHSKVMELASYLTDVYGPRLTGSPEIKEAAEWAGKTMRDWGLANVHLEPFPFG